MDKGMCNGMHMPNVIINDINKNGMSMHNGISNNKVNDLVIHEKLIARV